MVRLGYVLQPIYKSLANNIKKMKTLDLKSGKITF
jgi:hypothetical protein